VRYRWPFGSRWKALGFAILMLILAYIQFATDILDTPIGLP
jgi:hypothetical protein